MFILDSRRCCGPVAKEKRRGPNVTKTTPSRTLLHWSTLSSCSFMNYFKSGKANWKKQKQFLAFVSTGSSEKACNKCIPYPVMPPAALLEGGGSPRPGQACRGRGGEKNRNKKTRTRTTRNSISRLHFVPSLDVSIACQPSFQQRLSHKKQVGIQLNVPARPWPTLTRLPRS